MKDEELGQHEHQIGADTDMISDEGRVGQQPEQQPGSREALIVTNSCSSPEFRNEESKDGHCSHQTDVVMNSSTRNHEEGDQSG